MKLHWLGLFLIALPLVSGPAAGVRCQAERDSITYCVADGGQTHLLIVDLNDPYLRVQTVMANDVLDVWPPEEERERIVDVAKRYRELGAVIAVNGDYFGANRGPEGPTAVQGQRLDTVATIMANPSHYRRTTLAVSRSGTGTIGYLDPISSLSSFAYRDLLFNAVSGGPLILLNGQPLPEDLSCFIDRIPVNSCRRNRQTVAGFDESGRILFLGVSEERSTQGMAELLREYGAFTAMKLDAGGSSQLWYRGRMLVDSPRGVANALLVFREDRPRHAAQLIARPPVLLLETNAQDMLDVPLHNTGYLPWTADRHYGLQKTGGAALTPDFVPLPADVAPESDGLLSLPIKTSSHPGVFSSTWQLAMPFETFGPTVPVNVIVLPREADDLRQQIEPLLDRVARLSDKNFEREWPQTIRNIQRLIEQWVREHPEPGEAGID